ncbi:hypothetical protein G7077_12040 [Sphingomonas piscis]|uniref:Uncharacterized protein n=1 Tax=Sphingomonas piscis TaxID=2714943 RepID=A0A6G7YS10_9SPHN|nr:hypothetical protein [Sphingomonas piscis]QIK79530.1 hypothetical protein G7077_12040 [Sphingomonas piscis]
MIKRDQQQQAKSTVDLKVSRIRRDPPPPLANQKALRAYSTEREARTVIIGVLLFAIALAIITLGVSDFTSR